MAIEHPAPWWTNQDIILYHGTTAEAARRIAAGRIDLVYGKRRKDFGPGFYTTTIEVQASRWAVNVAARRKKDGRAPEPAVVRLALGREELASLECLAFVDGHFAAEQFWSFVPYCRSGSSDHGRTGSGTSPGHYYDVVYGPMSNLWEQRKAFWRADQISFHTPAAIDILNTKAVRRMITL